MLTHSLGHCYESLLIKITFDLLRMSPSWKKQLCTTVGNISRFTVFIQGHMKCSMCVSVCVCASRLCDTLAVYGHKQTVYDKGWATPWVCMYPSNKTDVEAVQWAAGRMGHRDHDDLSQHKCVCVFNLTAVRGLGVSANDMHPCMFNA